MPSNALLEVGMLLTLTCLIGLSASRRPPRQVDYDGAFPIEGAKEVATLMTRYVTRALREESLLDSSPLALHAEHGAAAQPPPGVVQLRIAPDGRRLVAEAEERAPAARAAPQLGYV